MKEERKYPISEGKFEELVEPALKRELKKPGCPMTVSHYKFFCGVLYQFPLLTRLFSARI
ncbi:hypothetical protein [Candidatus Tisiphia endosymbiont of Beris chalybata]|uniref:hypothetical protein n=1 Tax=Candidatus Tisiphia endosymbiont of Beris chalybata TaxID=3066262 RepID=UPI00312C97A8